MDKEYYVKNKEKINARRRERYRTDPEYHARRAEETRVRKKKYPEKFKVWRARYYQAHKEKFSARARKWVLDNPDKAKEYRARRKKKILDAIYGHYGSVCKCCGETQIKFLTIDHVNNDGYKERRRQNGSMVGGGYLYARIVNAGFPMTYQILCMNCNFGKSRNGGVCPHKND